MPPSSDPLSPVPGGGHVLIVPLEHVSSLLLPSNPNSLLEEIASWRIALKKTYSEYNAISVSWEIGRLGGVGSRASHTQIQVVPIPSNLGNGLENAFLSSAKEMGYKFAKEDEVEESIQIVEGKKKLIKGENDGKANYCRLDLGDKTFILWLDEKENKRFSLQWPR